MNFLFFSRGKNFFRKLKKRTYLVAIFSLAFLFLGAFFCVKFVDFNRGKKEIKKEKIVQTLSVENISEDGVKLKGKITNNKVDGIYFQWGVLGDSKKTVKAEKENSSNEFYHILSDLDVGKEYVFCAVGKHGEEVFYGEEVSFFIEKENDISLEQKVKTGGAGKITADSVVLNGSFSLEENKEEKKVRFAYGKEKYNFSFFTDWLFPKEENFSYRITNLGPGEVYYFRTEVEENAEIFLGNTSSFKTLPFNKISDDVKNSEVLETIVENEGKIEGEVIEISSEKIKIEKEDFVVEFFFEEDIIFFINPITERREYIEKFNENYTGDSCPRVPESDFAEFRLREVDFYDITKGEKVILYFFHYKEENYLVSRVIAQR